MPLWSFRGVVPAGTPPALPPMPERPHCDLDHERATRAVVRIQVKSTRLGRAGHPMIRELVRQQEHPQEIGAGRRRQPLRAARGAGAPRPRCSA
jgi:hypothetical protein